MGQTPQAGQKYQYVCETCGQKYNDGRYANQHKRHFQKQGRDFLHMTGRESKMDAGHDKFKRVEIDWRKERGG
jgi:hypothetical protein